MPDPLEPTILTNNGVPVYLSTSIGGGLHEIDVQNFVNVQQFGMSPVQANSMPHFFSINFGGDYSKFPANQSLPVVRTTKHISIFGNVPNDEISRVALVGSREELLPRSLRWASQSLKSQWKFHRPVRTHSLKKRLGINDFLFRHAWLLGRSHY